MTREQLTARSSTERNRDLLGRAYDILTDNLRTEQDLPWAPYRCAAPGPKGDFLGSGIWNWDSAFHAIGFSQFDIALAEESILGFLQFQLDSGLLPDVIFDNGDMVDTFGKPPVFATAVETVYRRGGSREFLQRSYKVLVKNEAFWRNNRLDKGLFHYDTDNPDRDGYEERARYESGWDNAVRWDDGITKLWPVDLNCFMVMTYRSLAYIAAELGLDASVWAERETALVQRINESLWHDGMGYCDTNRETGVPSPVVSPALFMPLYVTIADKSQAAVMERIAVERMERRMPTVSFDNPEYSNGYWRGTTWLNVAYYAAKGLRNYGFPVGDEIREYILAMCDAEKGGIFENYDSRTGKGLYCPRFCWSCVFVLEFILNF